MASRETDTNHLDTRLFPHPGVRNESLQPITAKDAWCFAISFASSMDLRRFWAVRFRWDVLIMMLGIGVLYTAY